MVAHGTTLQGEWLDLAVEDAARRLQWLQGDDPSQWPPPPPAPHPAFVQHVDNALLLPPASPTEAKDTRPTLTKPPPVRPAPPLEESLGWRIGACARVID